MRTCEYGGCERLTKSGKLLCPAHDMRKYRGMDLSGELREYGLSPRERLGMAAHRYADAESQTEMERAMALILYYARLPLRKRRRKNCSEQLRE